MSRRKIFTFFLNRGSSVIQTSQGTLYQEAEGSNKDGGKKNNISFATFISPNRQQSTEKRAFQSGPLIKIIFV